VWPGAPDAVIPAEQPAVDSGSLRENRIERNQIPMDVVQDPQHVPLVSRR